MTSSDRLLALLAASGRPHTVLDHDEARTAAEAAAARGTALSEGGKSLVLKVERIGFVVLLVGSARRLEGRLLRKALHVQRYRFATADELAELGGLHAGEVPPFGRPLFDATLYAGRDVLERERLVFAAASPTRSVAMTVGDWQAVAAPTLVDPFTVPE